MLALREQQVRRYREKTEKRVGKEDVSTYWDDSKEGIVSKAKKAASVRTVVATWWEH